MPENQNTNSQGENAASPEPKKPGPARERERNPEPSPAPSGPKRGKPGRKPKPKPAQAKTPAPGRDNGPDMSDSQIEARNERIALDYIQAWSVPALAEKYDLHPGTIRHILIEWRRRWHQEATDLFAVRKAEELQKLDRVESELWEAWRRSIGTVKKTVKRARQAMPRGKKNETAPAVIPMEQTVTEHSQDMVGDPRFMAQIQQVIEFRCRLLGYINEGVKVDSANISARIADSRAAILDKLNRISGQTNRPKAIGEGNA